MLTPQIRSLQHPLVKRLVSLRLERSAREEEGLVFVSGKNLLKDLAAHFPFRHFLKTSDIEWTPKADEIITCSFEVMKKITGVVNPEGVAATLPLPSLKEIPSCRLLLIGDAISDPGNLGSLIRSALGLGFDALLLTPGSVDPFNEKALRAAKGATFHLPIYEGLLPPSHPFHLYAADAHGKPLDACAFKTPLALILGNEAQGISPALAALATPLSIPLTPSVESLNVAVAGAIFMHHIRRVS